MPATGCAPPKPISGSVRRSVAELESILDTATDGVIVLDETGRILSLNRSAEALFGYDQREVVGEPSRSLLRAGKPHRRARLSRGLRSSGVASLLNDGREVIGPRAPGRRHPALHDDGLRQRGSRPEILRGAARHHGLQEGGGRADRRQARGRAGELAEIGSSGQDQPRDQDAAQRHHRLRRGDAGGALRSGRQRALQGIPQGRPRLGRACHQPRQRPPRSRQDRGGADGIVLHQRQPQRARRRRR